MRCCVLVLSIFMALALAGAAPAATTLWLSVGPHGEAANANCWYCRFSRDGRHVAFTSHASNLVPSHPAGDLLTLDVFVRDLVTGATEQVNVTDWGVPVPMYLRVGRPQNLAISDDGRYVAFATDSAAGGDPNVMGLVFLRDRVARHTTCVSRTSTGGQANGYSLTPALSGDGRYVAFASDASNLVSGDANDATDIFLRDTVTSTLERVSVGLSGEEGFPLDEATSGSYWPALNADGRFVAFACYQDGLLPGDHNGMGDVVLRDRAIPALAVVSSTSTSGPADHSSRWPSLSADARYAVFSSTALNLDPRVTHREEAVYLKDVATGAVEAVSLNASGEQAWLDACFPAVSDDGRFVAYWSAAGNLVPGDTNEIADVFLRDRLAGTTARVSINCRGEQGEPQEDPDDRRGNAFGSISGDGTTVAFIGASPNLAPRSTGTISQVYAWDSLARFPDVPHVFWAFAGIEACANAGIVSGYPDGQYWPGEPVDRAQMAVYMARTLCGGESGVPPYSGASPFPDVDATAYAWALPHIVYLKNLGIVSGYPDGGYHPAETVTRAQMAVYVARCRGWIPLEGPMDTAPDLFPDVLAGYWAGTAIQACKEHGVVAGYADGYHPEETVTRGQMAVYVQRGFGLG